MDYILEGAVRSGKYKRPGLHPTCKRDFSDFVCGRMPAKWRSEAYLRRKSASPRRFQPECEVTSGTLIAR